MFLHIYPSVYSMFSDARCSITNHNKAHRLPTTIVMLSLAVSVTWEFGRGSAGSSVWGYLLRLQSDGCWHSGGLTKHLSLSSCGLRTSPGGLSACAGLSFLTSWQPQGSSSSKRGRSSLTFSDLALKIVGNNESPRIKGRGWRPHLLFGGRTGALLVEQPVFHNHCEVRMGHLCVYRMCDDQTLPRALSCQFR